MTMYYLIRGEMACIGLFLFLAIHLTMLFMYLVLRLGTVSYLRSIGDYCDYYDDNRLISIVSCILRLYYYKYKL